MSAVHFDQLMLLSAVASRLSHLGMNK